MTDDEFEERLRRALAGRAGQVEPGPEGLRAIRVRTARRPRRERWRAPVIALAGTAALLGAVSQAPRLLPDAVQEDSGGGAGAGAAPPAATLPADPDLTGTTPVPASAGPSVRPSDVPIPGAGVNDLATVWPYGSRAAGYAAAEPDMTAGRLPDLTRADTTAVTFVESYVGASQALTATSAGAWKAGIRMVVRRGDVVVSLVYLVRVRVGSDAPYVVVDATAPGALTLTGTVVGGRVAAAGTVPAPTRLDVQLRAPGSKQAVSAARGPVDPEWTAVLGRDPALRVTALAAWTTDPDRDVTAFAALPLVN